METFTTEELERWIDRSAVDKASHKLGTIADVYVDDATGRPEWLAVMTGLFGSRMSFVPLSGATELGEKIQVAFEKSMIKDSPNIDADGQLTEEEEERLYRHYGITYGKAADSEVADLQQEGSLTLNGEVSPEVARARMRKSDAAFDSIDLRSDESEKSKN